MTIIIDANVLIAALIKDGIVRKTIIDHPGEWIVPAAMFDEVWEHRSAWNKNKLHDKELRDVLNSLIEDFVIVIADSVYHDHASRAKQLVSDIDDWPLIALAMSVDNEGIWSFNEKHLSKSKSEGIKIFSTSMIVSKVKSEHAPSS